MPLHSKLPDQGVTIFSVMTDLAQQHNALNLSQGFPNFAPPAALLDAFVAASHAGHHQYPAGDGLLALREQVAAQVLQRDGVALDPIHEITVTAGATIALYCAIQALVHTGDEVIVFDPCYDSYDPAIRLAGGQPIHLPLTAPDFSVDWQALRDAITPRTKMIVVNTPHNPTGAVWLAQDWQQLQGIIGQRDDIVVLSDEVYEHLLFDGLKHEGALTQPWLNGHCLVVGSFGKSFHVTGWKTGYILAAPKLMQLFRQVYQFANFCGTTPCQVALAQFMREHPEHVTELPTFYQAKRDAFLAGLADSDFKGHASRGTYFQLLNYAAIRPDLTDTEMCQWLVAQHRIACIPLSPFYAKPPQGLRLLRFCFAKTDETLQKAGEILLGVG